MKTLYDGSYKKIVEMLEQYPIEKMVFWVGAGIDADAPSGLPLGDKLMQKMLEDACGVNIKNNIINCWKQTSARLRDIDNEVPVMSSPRLEVILEGISNFENHLLIPNHSIINGLKSFQDVPPNESHYILAELLHKGVNIITTNYENCIATAYNRLFGGQGYTLKLQPKEENLYTFKSNFSKAGKIYYIHGIAYDLKEIGATLSVVKNPLSGVLTKIMEDWFANDYCFIFMGYGAGDALDVNPYFKHHAKLEKSTGIFIRHNMKRNECRKSQCNPNEKALLQCFRQGVVLHYNTQEFLKKYGKYENILKSSYRWEEEYNKYKKAYSQKMQSLCALSICYALSLDPQKIIGYTWREILLDHESEKIVDNWYLGYFGFQNAVRANDRLGKIISLKRLKKSRLLYMDIAATKKNTILILLEWMLNKKMLSTLETHIENDEIITWEVSTPLNHFIFSTLKIIQILPLPIGTTRELLKHQANKIISLWEKVISKGTRALLEYNQLNVALVGLGLFEQIFNKKSEIGQNLNTNAKENYLEVNSITGIINTLIYRCIGDMITYYDTQNVCFLKTANVNYSTAWKLVVAENLEYKYRVYFRMIKKLRKKILHERRT